MNPALSDSEVKDTRGRPRYVFKPPIEGTFNAYPIRLINISASGAQIEHADPLKLHSSAKLAVPLPRSIDTITVRGQLVWSKLSRSPNAEGKYLYRSGIKLDGQGPAIAAAVDRIITIYSGEEDRDSLERKKAMLKDRAAKEALRQGAGSLESTWRHAPVSHRNVDPDKALLIEQTFTRLQKEPQEIPVLVNRAKRALEGKPEGTGVSDEALAVWEYLERLVPVAMITQVLSKK